MSCQDDDLEAREREVDNALWFIDNLTVHEARSILRWAVTNDEDIDRSALRKIAKSVHMTFFDADADYDDGINTLQEFSNTRSAKLNWERQRNEMLSRCEEVRDKHRHVTNPTIPLTDLW